MTDEETIRHYRAFVAEQAVIDSTEAAKHTLSRLGYTEEEIAQAVKNAFNRL